MLRNVFKGLYSVPKGESLLIIGKTSCHEISPATYNLISNLPDKGSEPDYLRELGRLGAVEPERILKKLMISGCLIPARPWYSREMLLRSIFAPSVELISGRIQQKLLSFLKTGAYSGETLFRFTAIAAAIGLLSSLLLLLFDWRVASSSSSGGVLLPALILLSILVHELGHSSLAHLNGIGFRPIGLSVYLVYPVFYTNVSGVGDLPLKRRLSVNLGGLAFQSVFAFLLLLVYAVSRETIVLAAVSYILYLLLFNLNPLISTDGYWCWKDVSDAYKDNHHLKYLQRVYDTLSVLFSGYLIYVASVLLFTVLGYLRLFGLQRAVYGWQALANAYVFLLLLSGVYGRLKLYFPSSDKSPVEYPLIFPPDR